MKKNGFTLAEVLITLAIIGVVAVLTLPALNSNTQEQQARAALKKMSNTLSQAASMNAAIDGLDFSTLNTAAQGNTITTDNPLGAQGSLLRLLQERCAVDTLQSFATVTSSMGTNVNTAVYFRDNTAIYFDGANAMAAGTIGNVANNELADDGVAKGIPVILDTNGSKGPNQVSNCVGTVAGLTDWDDDDGGVCGTPNQRVIRDQFIFRLRGTMVTPIGAASNWMIDNSKTDAPAGMEQFAMEEGEEGEEGGNGGNTTP